MPTTPEAQTTPVTPGCGDEDLMDLDQTTGLCGMCSRQQVRESKERDYEDNYVPVSEPVPAEARLPPIFQPLEARRDRLVATLLGAGFEEKPAISGRVRRFAYCNDYWVIVPNGPAAESQEDFARALDTAEAALKRLTSTVDAPHLPVAFAPVDAVEPSAADGGATPSPAAEPLHPLEARRASLIARLYMAGFAKVDGPAEYLWRFNGPNGAVLIPVGHPCEVERDFGDMLDHAEKECAKVEAAAMPADAVEPSVGDVADAPLFVGGTDSAPMQPMSPDLAALAARGQQPTAPGPTLAEVQAQLERERERANKAEDERDTLRGGVRKLWGAMTGQDYDASSAEEASMVADLDLGIAAIAEALDPEDSPAFDANDQPIPLPARVQTALMPDTAYERELRKSLHAVEAELFEVDRTLQHLGAYGNGPTIDRLLKVLTPGDRRNILELQAAEARMDLARLKARRLSPPPPGRLEEYAAKVAAIEAKIAALPSLPPSTTPLADDLRDLVGRIRCECPGEEAAAVCAELLTVAETLARMEVR